MQLAVVYAKAGRREEALKLLEQINARAKQQNVSRMAFAKIYLNLGDKEAGIRVASKGLRRTSARLTVTQDGVQLEFFAIRSPFHRPSPTHWAAAILSLLSLSGPLHLRPVAVCIPA